MSEIRKAITSLGQIEQRLRRALNLVGEVGASVITQATPVVLVADATSPGNNDSRGRRFMLTATNITVAGGASGFEFLTDVVLTRIAYAGTAAIGTVITARLVAPGTAPQFAMDAVGTGLANYQGGYVERSTTNTETLPVLAGAAVGAFDNGRRFANFFPATTWCEVIREPIFVGGLSGSTGGRITFRCAAAVVSDYLIIEGYAY